jgi:hypothetical protein
MLGFMTLSVITLRVIMLSVIMLSVILLTILNVVILKVIARWVSLFWVLQYWLSLQCTECLYATCHYAKWRGAKCSIHLHIKKPNLGQCQMNNYGNFLTTKALFSQSISSSDFADQRTHCDCVFAISIHSNRNVFLRKCIRDM